MILVAAGELSVLLLRKSRLKAARTSSRRLFSVSVGFLIPLKRKRFFVRSVFFRKIIFISSSCGVSYSKYSLSLNFLNSVKSGVLFCLFFIFSRPFAKNFSLMRYLNYKNLVMSRPILFNNGIFKSVLTFALNNFL